MVMDFAGSVRFLGDLVFRYRSDAIEFLSSSFIGRVLLIGYRPRSLNLAALLRVGDYTLIWIAPGLTSTRSDWLQTGEVTAAAR